MSETVPKLSAKVYWDRDSQDMDLSLALRGLQWLSQLCPAIEMIEESRHTNLLIANKNNVYWRALPSTLLDADMNFVVTRKRLINDLESVHMVDEQVPEAPNITLGLALPAERLGTRRLAIISMDLPNVVDQILVHEAAHLMGYSNSNNQTDTLHCPDQSCLMYHADVDAQQHNFCNSCHEQLPRNAQALREAKFGKYALAPNAIFDPAQF